MNDYEFMREDMQSDVRILGGQARARRCLNFSILEPAGALCSRRHVRRDDGATDRLPPPQIIWEKPSVPPPTNRSGFSAPAGLGPEKVQESWVQ